MTHPKAIILLLFLVFSFIYCKAQEGNKYVYQDSSVQSAPGKASEVAPPDSVTSIVATGSDTILRLNSLVISSDSIKALKNSQSFAYAKNLDSLLKDLQRKQEAKEERIENSENKNNWLDIFFNSTGTKIFLWSLAVLFILFVLYKLIFTQSIFQKGVDKNNVNELNQDEAINNDYDYNKLIEQSVKDNNYRLAVRYLYLQSLLKLSECSLIKLVADKTNFQYINELSNTIYKEEFSWLTLNYEYVWYGEFDLNKETFTQLQNSFWQFNSRLQKN